MITDNSPLSTKAVSVALTDERMPDAVEAMQLLEKYIDDEVGGVHDDGAHFAQSDCRLIQATLRFARAAIERARQAGEPDPMFV